METAVKIRIRNEIYFIYKGDVYASGDEFSWLLDKEMGQESITDPEGKRFYNLNYIAKELPDFPLLKEIIEEVLYKAKEGYEH